MKKLQSGYWNLFFVISGCIAFYFLLQNLGAVYGVFRSILSILSPVVYGFVIAYLLSPIMRSCEKLLIRLFRKGKGRSTATKIGAVVMTYLILFFMIGLLILIVAPVLASSVSTLVNNFSTYSADFTAWADHIINNLKDLSTGEGIVYSQIETLLEKGQEIISSLASGIVELFPSAITFLTDITTILGYLVFGFILSIYMLCDKERMIGRIKKLIVCLFKKSHADRIILFFREINETVGDYIVGKLLDSFIIGVISYIVFAIMRLSFAPLLAFIVMVTNIIPVLGPIIGAIPCGLILLFVNPKQVIPFVIAIIVIQQFDGNILGPKILSKITGISGFWVMISIIIGGGLFGIFGMVLSVPIFGVCYELLKEHINRHLAAREMSYQTDDYIDYPYPPAPINPNPPKKQPISLFRVWKKKKSENSQKNGEE